MGTRLCLIGIAIQRAPDRVGRVSIIIDYQIRMSPGTAEPAVDFLPVLSNRDADCLLSGFTIRPSGSGSNIAFVAEPLPKFAICASNVFVERVAAGSFVPRKIANSR